MLKFWLILGCVTAFAFRLFAGTPIVVIYGEAANANVPGEISFSSSLAKHAARWFREGGLEVDVSNDCNLSVSLKNRKIAMLVHCQNPSSSQIREYQSFVQKGGRLIVTYSSSSALAKLVGVKLGNYKKTPNYCQFSFPNERPQNCPPIVIQKSPNIATAVPDSPKSRVLAWWCDASGKPSADAAWLCGPGGYWMTHVLLADGDAEAKARLLVSFVGAVAPDLWSIASQSKIAICKRVGPWSSPENAIASIQKLPQSKRKEKALLYAKESFRLMETAKKLASTPRASEAWSLAHDAHSFLLAAFGSIQNSSPGEICAVWDHSGLGLYPGDWKRTCRELSAAGITDLFVNFAAPGYAHYPSAILPSSPVLGQYGDQVSACLSAARNSGLRVHAWIICFSTTGATSQRINTFRTSGWLLDATGGGQHSWLDPSSSSARAFLVSAAQEILTRYNVDGLHLDFVRYDNYYGSLGYGTRIRFEREHRQGKPIQNWPKAARYGSLFQEVVRWRAKQITSFVADIRAMQRRVAPGATLSAAVLGKYPSCIESAGQDWMVWLSCGYLDYVLPMNYTENPALYEELLSNQLAKRSTAQKIIGGIGVTSAESRLTADKVIEQILALRKGGAAGFVLFDLDTTLSREILPILQLGATQK